MVHTSSESGLISNASADSRYSGYKILQTFTLELLKFRFPRFESKKKLEVEMTLVIYVHDADYRQKMKVGRGY